VIEETATARRLGEFKHVSMTPHARRLNIVLDAGGFPSGNPSRLLPDPPRLQSPSEQFYTDSAGQRAHPFKSRGDPAPKQVGRREGAMHGSQSYRYNAKECLLAAKEAPQPYHRKLRLSMASS
jgi:hypothetical protein